MLLATAEAYQPNLDRATDFQAGDETFVRMIEEDRLVPILEGCGSVVDYGRKNARSPGHV